SKTCAALSLVVSTFTITFFAFDWLMSLTPRFHSTAFGLLILTHSLLISMSVLIGTVLLSRRRTGIELSRVAQLDLGNLLLMSVLLFAYIGFAQYLLIWSGQLPNELLWYVNRSQGP